MKLVYLKLCYISRQWVQTGTDYITTTVFFSAEIRMMY